MVNKQLRLAHRSLLLGLLLSLTAGCVANPPAASVQGKPGSSPSASTSASTSATNASAPSGPSADSSSASLPPPDSVTRDLHPSGPTVVRTWGGSAGTPPDRIELTHARSGRRLIGQARLLRQAAGQWVVQNSAGFQQALRVDAPTSSVSFEESGQRWRVRVLKQSEPVAKPGIATEDEPNLDLVLERLP
ncbi:hypothetical protein [Hylemonella gracilis]|uniref:Lipoprotein n=1 Tax=Hylemonella gracilis ATCC 19624 TaxID=887062 RepID=F3KNN4_9BURK|nr:hypothetical protein [Hylemonella gracilis]EGI78600.1 hypothetical protein HGR_00130 [Hylemonella gracilis ATCC 19624]